MGNKNRGLYEKFTVTRNDGSSEPGGKHHGCEYFVLDLTHDKHAAAAALAYAHSCAAEYPLLASDLLCIVDGSNEHQSDVQAAAGGLTQTALEG